MSEHSLATTKLHFPEPWYEAKKPDSPLDYVHEMEVRKLPGSPEGEFFFAALDPNYYYAPEWNPDQRKPIYSKNSFAVNFTPAPRVRVATEQEWESASRIATQPRRLVLPNSPDHSSGEVEYRGKKFPKVGKYWGEGAVSPAGKWLAIFSYTGERTRDLFMDGGTVKSGDIFWQVYDTATGEKVFDWKARGVQNPLSSGPVVWLEERYFLLPTDPDGQKFIVVTLPEFIPEKNPVTIRLPSRKDDAGGWLPAPSRGEVWVQLDDLTRERAAEITTPPPPELFEARRSTQSSSRELLLAIKEETENRPRHQPARGLEGARDYNYRVFSTYYYAVSLDDPTTSRIASKDEWNSGRVLTSSRAQIPPDRTSETWGSRREYPKTGALLAGYKPSYMHDWIAVFSYTPDAETSAAGKMFVDILETHARNKFSSTEFPYTESAAALFNGALWIDRNYLIVPLDTSFNSFALWQLPGGGF